MIANMAAMEALDSAIKDHDMGALAEQPAVSVPDLAGGGTASQPATPRTDQNKAGGPKAKTVAQELELIFQRDTGLTAGGGLKDKNSLEILKASAETKSSSANSTPLSAKKKVYTSVAQMKRSKRGPGELLHKDFHSTPELQGVQPPGMSQSKEEEEEGLPDLEPVLWETRKSQSQEDLHLASQESAGEWSFPKKDNADHPGYFTLPHKKSHTDHRTLTRIRPVQHQTAPPGDHGSPISGPPPSHPPPPPPLPTAQLGVDTSGRPPSDYARVGEVAAAPASSFNPASNARLYESPQDVADIGYKSPDKTNGETAKKRSPTRTHSLPPRPSRPMVLKRIEVFSSPRLNEK
jgi:SH3/ankyrin repeat-containing protein